MTDAEERYAKAKQRVRARFLDPLTELLGTAEDRVQELTRERDRAVTTMEVLRPVWAQGFTSDSEAAQASSNALAQLWQMLGAENQTAACQRLRHLLTLVPPNVEWDDPQRLPSLDVRARGTWHPGDDA